MARDSGGRQAGASRGSPGGCTASARTDLHKLADQKTGRDASPSNGSSIALLVEYRGASVILGADAFGNVLGAALRQLARSRGTETLPVDAFKLPHHGSQNNITIALIGIAPARHYLVSTNGDTFRAPRRHCDRPHGAGRPARRHTVVQLPQPTNEALGRRRAPQAARLLRPLSRRRRRRFGARVAGEALTCLVRCC